MKQVLWSGILWACASLAQAAEGDAQALAETMRQARFSAGFEARFNVLVTKPNGVRLQPIKLAMIGQASAERQRVLIRTIAPAEMRDHVVVAEMRPVSQLAAWQYQGKNPSDRSRYDPYAKLFGTGLVLWDMMGGWWFWPNQMTEGLAQINGHECIKMRSVTDDKRSTIQEVESCVDPVAKVSLRTRFITADKVVARTITVEKLVRKHESAMVAKKLNVRWQNDELTEVEVYAGDDQYEVAPETFAALDQREQSGEAK